MNVSFWGIGDFPVIYLNRGTSRNAWNRHSGSFMVGTGILFNNMKSASNEIKSLTFWPSNSYGDFPTDKTFHQIMIWISSMTFTKLRGVFMEHLQRVWHDSRERLPFWTARSVPFGTCLCSSCLDQFYRTCLVFPRLFAFNIHRYFLDFA